MSEQRRRTRVPKETATVTKSADMNDTIDLVELAYRLLAGWKLIVCLALVCAIAMGAYTVYRVTPMYEATSTIYILNRSDSAISMADLQIGAALTQDYIKVFKVWEVHEQVISNLNLNYTYGQMRNMLRVTNDSNTRMLDITVKSPSPTEAAVIANEYAKVASLYIADIMSTDKPNVVSVALPPANPVSPNKTKNIMMGFLLGAVMACAYLVLRFLMDDKYKTAEDIRRYTGLTTLAMIPVEPARGKAGSRRH